MDVKYLDTFGKRLSFLLDIREMKQKDLADAINVTKNSISMYVNGLRHPDVDTLKKIADVLNVNSDFLMLRDDDYRVYSQRLKEDKTVELIFNKDKKKVSKEELDRIFQKLSDAGFDIDRLFNQ